MDSRKWSSVYKEIKNNHFYDGVIETLEELKSSGIKIAIVSNAPSSYINKVLSFYDVEVDLVIAYHDVIKHKPSPEGVYKVIEHFNISKNETFYVGDNDVDIDTAKNSEIEFYGVKWGSFSTDVSIYNFK